MVGFDPVFLLFHVILSFNTKSGKYPASLNISKTDCGALINMTTTQRGPYSACMN